MSHRAKDRSTSRDAGPPDAVTDIATFGETLDALCLLVDEQWSGITTGVLLLDKEGRHWQSIAGSRMAEVWRLTASTSAITPTCGAANAAAHRREQVIVSDVATDALYDENRRALLKAGYHACWATPFFAHHGRLHGVVVMHCHEPRQPTEAERRVIDRLVHLAGIAVDRKLDRDVLEASEQRWRSLFESSAIGIAITDQSGRFIGANRAYQQLSGYSEEELLTMHHLELTVEEDLDVTLELRKCLHAGELHETRVEKRYRCKDGRVRWVRVTTSILPYSLGSSHFLLGIAEDITDRKRAEQELRRSEANLADGQRLSHTGSWACHPTGLLFWSQETFRITGFDPVAGPPTLLQLRERVHPHDLAQFDTHLHDALDTHREIRGEFRILHPGGEIKHIDCIGHPMFSETGELVEYVGTIMDITERKRAEEQLWRSAAYLAEAERLGHTGCWVCDLATDVHYWSPEMYRILGIDPEGPVDFEKLRQRIHPEDEPLLARLVDESIAARRAYEGECRLLLPDGTLKYVKFIARPLVSPSANLDGYVGAFMDVTELKRVEQQLASSLAEVRLLAARSSR